MAQKNEYDRIEDKNIANILAKLKEGKTLTASDNKALENHRRKREGLRPQMTETELAREFGVDRRGSIVRWKKQGAPFDSSNHAMYEWLITNNIVGATDWKRKYREENPGKFPVKKKTAKKKPAKTKTAEELRDEYFADLHNAKENGDEAREKVALDAYLKIDKQIRDQEAHAKRLGIDRGEMLARSEVVRILQALFYAGNACCHKYSKQIAQRLSHKEPGEIYEILAPQLTSLSIFEALEKVAKTPGKINLPDWVIECSKTEARHYIKYSKS